MPFFPIKKFQAKITIVLILAIVFVLSLSNMLVYKFTLDEQFESLRNKLMMVARTAALAVDPEALQRIPLNVQSVDAPEFQAIREKLSKIKEANPVIKYIYTMGKTDKDGIWQFIVDAEPFSNRTKEVLTSLPGDKYDASRFPEMMKAFDGPAADKKLEIDEWGVTLSGYAPIINKDNQVVAIIGIDVDAQDVYLLYRATRLRMGIVFVFGIILSLVVGVLFSREIHEPVSRLVEGTRRIAGGDLKYQVNVKGQDEISELGHSFNRMAQDLNLARQRLVRYFYNIIRSMIKVLEAKDEYTKGHSEKVARYAGKIAFKLGYTKREISLFRKMTLLHDIGKVGIKDNILSKPDKLSPEEWDIIKKHPVIGENILKPILDNSDMLSVVRGHHERYDGKGYPDGLSRDQINIFAAIVAVADAFDAMTSDRAYRKALSKEEAIEELKRNRSSQFHPKVVDAFLEILKEEEAARG